jgi:sugar phosphate isomerase/epimerase
MIKVKGETISRRSILVGSGALLASPAVLGRSLPSESQIGQKTKNMHLSLAAYSVRKALTSGEKTLFDFIDWCAALGLPGTELTSYYFEEGFDSAYLRRLRNRAFRNGVTISGTAIRNDFCLPPGPEKDEQVAQVKKWLDSAADLFAPHVRIFAGRVPEGADKESAIRWTADGIKSVLDHAEKRGVLVGLENHGGITELAEDVLAICKQVGEHPWFGVNLDTGNYRKDPYEELRQTAPLAVNVQIKVEITESGKKVPADLERFRDMLVETGYKGWVVLEYEAPEAPFTEIPKYLAKLEKLFGG